MAMRSPFARLHAAQVQDAQAHVAGPHVELTPWQHLQQQVSAAAYQAPWFVLRTTLQGVARHNLLGLSAALSFYALFALIPLIVLIFFLLSHLVYSSDYAIVKLAILTSNLLPEFSQRIMVEVYQNTQTRAAWGVLGFVLLLWTITPLATHMRASFYLISSRQDEQAFWLKKMRDVLAVLGVLMVFFLFTAAGFMLQSVVVFLAKHLPAMTLQLVGSCLSLALVTALIALFYRAFCPLTLPWRHLWLSALVTASLWLLMRPAFGLFLRLNEHFGAVFGSMKAMFVSITWLYLNFAIFLLGVELLVTLRQKDILLLKGLFDDTPNQQHYLQALVRRYGNQYQPGDRLMTQGEPNSRYYMVVNGTVQLVSESANGQKVVIRILKGGDFFGEIALFSAQPASAHAIVSTPDTTVLNIERSALDSLLQQEPNIALRLLTRLSHRVQVSPGAA